MKGRENKIPNSIHKSEILCIYNLSGGKLDPFEELAIFKKHLSFLKNPI